VPLQTLPRLFLPEGRIGERGYQWLNWLGVLPLGSISETQQKTQNKVFGAKRISVNHYECKGNPTSVRKPTYEVVTDPARRGLPGYELQMRRLLNDVIALSTIDGSTQE
jgi:hypothetical protein